MRVLAWTGLALLVLTGAIALLVAPGASLRYAMVSLDPDMLSATRSVVQGMLGSWVWHALAVPILDMTSWLTLGLPGLLTLLAGVTLSRQY